MSPEQPIEQFTVFVLMYVGGIVLGAALLWLATGAVRRARRGINHARGADRPPWAPRIWHCASCLSTNSPAAPCWRPVGDGRGGPIPRCVHRIGLQSERPAPKQRPPQRQGVLRAAPFRHRSPRSVPTVSRDRQPIRRPVHARATNIQERVVRQVRPGRAGSLNEPDLGRSSAIRSGVAVRRSECPLAVRHRGYRSRLA